jgi:proline iminopeptidase
MAADALQGGEVLSSKDESLYPLIEPYRSFRLPVGEGHELQVEESGNPGGLPVVFLHGGPGAGTKPTQRQTFDPAAFRIVTFDQRGAGRSTPHAVLDGNTTQDLVADIECLRVHLGIARWLVAGGSWGSCLALCYGEAHPERCLGFRLHGIFMGSAAEIDWWFNGSRMIFPDKWEAFANFVPEPERDDLLGAYARRLVSDDPAECFAAAVSLRTYSAATQTFLPDPEHVASLNEPMAALAVARLFTHYCVNRFFLEPGQILRDLPRIRHLPAEIVQGRYDTVTPMATAWALKRAWPEAQLTIVDAANHVATSAAPALSHALRAATDRLRQTVLADAA